MSKNVIISKKGVDYAASTGAAITKIKEAENLANGAFAFFKEDGGIISFAVDNTVNTNLTGVNKFRIAYNNNGQIFLSKPVVRKNVVNLSGKEYQAPVFHKVLVGGTGANDFPLTDDAVGTVGIRIADNTFSGMFATAFVNATVYKKPNMTVAQVKDKLLEKLNADNIGNTMKLNATAIGTTPNYEFQIESQDRFRILSVGVLGEIEGARIVTDGSGNSVVPVSGSGVGEDVLKMEEEALVYKGKGNYRLLGDTFYKGKTATDVSVNYDLFTFNETLDTPYRGEHNLRPEFVLAVDASDTAAFKTKVTNILNALALNDAV